MFQLVIAVFTLATHTKIIMSS